MAQKKVRTVALTERRSWIERSGNNLSIRRQCELARLVRSGLYYQAVEESSENLRLMRMLDEQYTATPFYGVARMTQWLRNQKYHVNPKRVRRLMRQMGLEAIYPKPRLSAPALGHRVYPYRLRGVTITKSDQVWSTDITYIRLRQGFVYLVAIIDWYSRYVLAWEVSVTLDSNFCISALEWALERGQPEIFNSDQGSQFTSADFTNRLQRRGILISMDGRGRALDNVFVERLWRTVKYEEVYLKDYRNTPEAVDSLGRFFEFYNRERIHQALGYKTPETVYRNGGGRKEGVVG